MNWLMLGQITRCTELLFTQITFVWFCFSMDFIMHSQTNYELNDFSHKSHFMVLLLKNLLMHSQTNKQINEMIFTQVTFYCFTSE